MAYKTVLVHVDESAHTMERIKIAAAVAMAEHAYLIGTATTGISRYVQQAALLSQLDENLMIHLEAMRSKALRGLQRFELTARQIGIGSFETRLVDDEAGGGICSQARYADLVVIGQHDPQHPTSAVMPDFPQYVVLNSGRPVLIVPCAGQCESIGKRVLIAWDDSISAARAVTNAMPLLRRAQTVAVVTFASEREARSSEPQSGAALAAYLERHGVMAEALQRKTSLPIGSALLQLAAEQNGDLVIMGGYGHVRYREILLGDVTRTVLEAAAIPVLMSH